MMTAKTLSAAGAVGALLAILATGVCAGSTEFWSDQPRAVFVDVYVFGCQPVEYDFAGAKDPLKPPALAIYKQVFVDVYDSDCHDFYFAEVVPRLELEQRPHTPD